MIRFACPGCQAIYNVKDDKAGKTGKCPACASQFLIPGTAAVTPAAPAPVPVSAPPQIPLPPPPPMQPAAVEIEPCPSCSARLTVEPANLGIDIACPECSATYLAVKLGSVPKPPPEPARKSSFGGKSGSSLSDALNTMKPKGDKPSSRKSVRRDEQPDETFASDEEDEDAEEEERPSRRRRSSRRDDDEPAPRRKRKRSKRGSEGGNKSVVRIISACLSLLAGAGQLLCGLGVMIAGSIIVAALTGVGASSNNPNAGNAALVGGGVSVVVFVGCGLTVILFSFLNIFAGIGALTRKPYGRVLTMIVSGLASIGAALDLFALANSLFQTTFVGMLIYGLGFAFALAHAVTGFMATIGEGAAEEFNQ